MKPEEALKTAQELYEQMGSDPQKVMTILALAKFLSAEEETA